MKRNCHVINFGCQMNVRDSQWLAGSLEARGFVQTGLADASIVIVNTCSVREKPEQKVLSTIGRIFRETGENPDVIVAIAGCVAQQLGQALFDASPQVRLVAGADGVAYMPDALERLYNGQPGNLCLLDFSKGYEEREQPQLGPSGPLASVSIMQGCDNFCTYCIVPFTRGRQKSRDRAAILAECRHLLGNGAREITLLGQNVNAYGKDNGSDVPFASLLAGISALPGLARLRYVTPHPADMGEADVLAFRDLPALCPRLHLPLQAGSDRVLKRMGRRYDRASYLRLVEDLRKARPDLALSTDLIVGFPGESEEDFAATLEMVRECAFMSSFSFCYSDRPGTRASGYPDKIDPACKQERLLRLQALQDELGQAWLDARPGQQTTLLIEGQSPRPSDGCQTWQGRDPYGVLVHVPLGEGDQVGRLVDVQITAAKKHCLLAREL